MKIDIYNPFDDVYERDVEVPDARVDLKALRAEFEAAVAPIVAKYGLYPMAQRIPPGVYEAVRSADNPSVVAVRQFVIDEGSRGSSALKGQQAIRLSLFVSESEHGGPPAPTSEDKPATAGHEGAVRE